MTFKLSTSQRKRLKRSLTGMVCVVILCSIFLLMGWLDGAEQIALDYRYAHFNRDRKPSDQIVLIMIDESSINILAKRYGRWPWPRHIYKELVEFLSLGEPSAILFDVMFTEPQLGTDDDRLFAEQSHVTPTVSQAMQLNPEAAHEEDQHVKLPDDLVSRFSLKWRGPTPQPLAKPFNDFAIPYPNMLVGLNRLHVVNTEKDYDGIFRHMPMALAYGTAWFPSLSLQGLIARLKSPSVQMTARHFEIYDGDQLKWSVPVDRHGRYQINFYKSAAGSQTPDFESISMASAVESIVAQQRGDSDPSKWPLNPMNLAGKTVIIGASATGLEDLKATPVSTSYPGVYLHASAVSNILDHDYLHIEHPFWTWFSLFILAVTTYLSVFFIDSIYLKALIPVVINSIYFAAAFFLFHEKSLAMQMSAPIAAGLLSFLDGFIYMSFIEGRDRRRMSGTLSKYLSPDVVAHLAEEGIDPSAEIGKQRELSILFSDIRGFTTMSEALPPEKVVAVLNEYLGVMTNLVFENSGTLDKFIGDAVMAFWGAPIENPLHARNAIEAALAMRKALEQLNAGWEQKGLAKLAIGIGINTGEVIVGNIGSEKRLDYTVIGDNVNLASRLEGLTKFYGTDLVIGPRTFELVSADFLCRPLDLVKVKGKHDAVAIYEPMQSKSDPTAPASGLIALCEKFTQGFNAYKTGDFKSALAFFEKCRELTMATDGPTQLYMKRCASLIKTPPDQWDGVYIAKTK